MKRSVLGSQSKNKPDEKKEGEGIDERANVECFQAPRQMRSVDKMECDWNGRKRREELSRGKLYLKRCVLKNKCVNVNMYVINICKWGIWVI